MTERNAILNEIKDLTIYLISKSVSINQNFPKYKNDEITWEKYQNLSFILKNESYEKVYNACVESKDYNLMLIDGGLIQLKYSFHRNNLIGHILCFYPNPNFEKFQDIPEQYEELYFGNELFSDVLDKKTIIFPIRFDFSEKHEEINHPKVHGTLGNYKDCRIPITKPISPKRFMSFVLRNFYNYKFQAENLEIGLRSNLKFKELTTCNEKKILHLSYD